MRSDIKTAQADIGLTGLVAMAENSILNMESKVIIIDHYALIRYI